MNIRIIAVAALGFAIVGCGRSTPPAATEPKITAAAVDGARLAAADTDAGNWMAPGRTYGEQRFSPLNKIDADNVKQLGLAWFYDLDVAHRAQEATPLVIDGVMYITGAWSKVFALNAKTGAPIWTTIRWCPARWESMPAATPPTEDSPRGKAGCISGHSMAA